MLDKSNIQLLCKQHHTEIHYEERALRKAHLVTSAILKERISKVASGILPVRELYRGWPGLEWPADEQIDEARWLGYCKEAVSYWTGQK